VQVRTLPISLSPKTALYFIEFRPDDWFIEKGHDSPVILQLTSRTVAADITELELDCSSALRENPVR